MNLYGSLYIKSVNFKVIFKHVRAHQNPPDKNSEKYIIWYGNNQADALANFSSNLSKETNKNIKNG